MLDMVTEQTNSCPPDRVIFVSRESRVVAVCDAPPTPEPVVIAEPLDLTADTPKAVGVIAPAATAVFTPAPIPKWTIEQGQSIRDALAAWIPADWTLAWDTPAAPLANVSFEYQGEAMDAIADLFDRRSIWPESPLTACSFPNERILQVRATGECGAP
ncbi:TcpQ domain-containing protein [Stenotrophomonas oahuensis]|uniref:TcpQ domain-containing protein n=1 Tax=Stenotrophomonas oahuensis TaxID=3003271 RepID=A0ABY9YW15_9GAMM|nr:TcpQ domain-containing protein [Stenotrophomonas sp. A5586]WNH54858.1 TcpQ domain-containing protein [Stenotrophomonas sp. A5586]